MYKGTLFTGGYCLGGDSLVNNVPGDIIHSTMANVANHNIVYTCLYIIYLRNTYLMVM